MHNKRDVHGAARPDGWDHIAAERRRQVHVLGYDHAHDDREETAERLAAAAKCYAQAAGLNTEDGSPPWPWETDKWTPLGRMRNLVRAGALYLAALDWMNRNQCHEVDERRLVLEKGIHACANAINEMLLDTPA